VCRPFPLEDDCRYGNSSFCEMWNTCSFMMWASVLLSGIVLVAYTAIFTGGYKKRDSGWKILSFLIGLNGNFARSHTFPNLLGLFQIVATSIMIHIFRTDERFYIGWKIGKRSFDQTVLTDNRYCSNSGLRELEHYGFVFGLYGYSWCLFSTRISINLRLTSLRVN
jgi:hypothetical protein